MCECVVCVWCVCGVCVVCVGVCSPDVEKERQKGHEECDAVARVAAAGRRIGDGRRPHLLGVARHLRRCVLHLHQWRRRRRRDRRGRRRGGGGRCGCGGRGRGRGGGGSGGYRNQTAVGYEKDGRVVDGDPVDKHLARDAFDEAARALPVGVGRFDAGRERRLESHAPTRDADVDGRAGQQPILDVGQLLPGARRRLETPVEGHRRRRFFESQLRLQALDHSPGLAQVHRTAHGVGQRRRHQLLDAGVSVGAGVGVEHGVRQQQGLLAVVLALDQRRLQSVDVVANRLHFD